MGGIFLISQGSSIILFEFNEGYASFSNFHLFRGFVKINAYDRTYLTGEIVCETKRSFLSSLFIISHQHELLRESNEQTDFPPASPSHVTYILLHKFHERERERESSLIRFFECLKPHCSPSSKCRQPVQFRASERVNATPLQIKRRISGQKSLRNLAHIPLKFTDFCPPHLQLCIEWVGQ